MPTHTKRIGLNKSETRNMLALLDLVSTAKTGNSPVILTLKQQGVILWVGKVISPDVSQTL